MLQYNQTKQNPMSSESCIVSQVITSAHLQDQGMGNSWPWTDLILLSNGLLPQGLNLGPQLHMLVKCWTTIPPHSKNSFRGRNTTYQWVLPSF